MIREHRLLMDDIATAEEHYAFAERLAAMARRLQARAARAGMVIDGEVAITTDQNGTAAQARSITESCDQRA